MWHGLVSTTKATVPFFSTFVQSLARLDHIAFPLRVERLPSQSTRDSIAALILFIQSNSSELFHWIWHTMPATCLWMIYNYCHIQTGEPWTRSWRTASENWTFLCGWDRQAGLWRLCLTGWALDRLCYGHFWTRVNNVIQDWMDRSGDTVYFSYCQTLSFIQLLFKSSENEEELWFKWCWSTLNNNKEKLNQFKGETINKDRIRHLNDNDEYDQVIGLLWKVLTSVIKILMCSLNSERWSWKSYFGFLSWHSSFLAAFHCSVLQCWSYTSKVMRKTSVFAICWFSFVNICKSVQFLDCCRAVDLNWSSLRAHQANLRQIRPKFPKIFNNACLY